jgi:hypothetical protein
VATETVFPCLTATETAMAAAKASGSSCYCFAAVAMATADAAETVDVSKETLTLMKRRGCGILVTASFSCYIFTSSDSSSPRFMLPHLILSFLLPFHLFFSLLFLFLAQAFLVYFIDTISIIDQFSHNSLQSLAIL